MYYQNLNHDEVEARFRNGEPIWLAPYRYNPNEYRRYCKRYFTATEMSRALLYDDMGVPQNHFIWKGTQYATAKNLMVSHFCNWLRTAQGLRSSNSVVFYKVVAGQPAASSRRRRR